MPKKFEFTGLRKYDPYATTEERAYSEGIDYYGGDTQVFLTDTADGAQPIRICCFRNISGGGLFNDMTDTSCYGQRHKSYMSLQTDSDPIELTISALCEDVMELIFAAFKAKKTLTLTIIYPNSHYVRGLVRVERVDFDSPIDSVFGYIVTFRRVFEPEIDRGLYYAVYELRGCTWASKEDENTYKLKAYYRRNETVKVPPPSALKAPYGEAQVNVVRVMDFGGTVLFDVTGSAEDKQINENWRIVPIVGEPMIDVKLVWDTEGVSTGRQPSSTGLKPEGTMYQLPTQNDITDANLSINNYRLTGWDIGGGEVKKPGEWIKLTKDMSKITAVWSPLYKVTLNSDREYDMSREMTGEGAFIGSLPYTLRGVEGDIVTLPANLPAYNGTDGYWACKEWVDMHDDEKRYQPSAKIKIAKTDIELKAYWVPRYKVTFTVGDGAMGTPPSEPEGTFHFHGDMVQMPSKTGTMFKGNYEFKGWVRDDDTEGKVITEGEYYKITGTESGYNINFAGYWEPTSSEE